MRSWTMESGRPVNHGAGRELTGFKRAYRLEKRQEAEARNAKTLPMRRRSFAKSHGFSRHSQWPEWLRTY